MLKGLLYYYFHSSTAIVGIHKFLIIGHNTYRLTHLNSDAFSPDTVASPCESLHSTTTPKMRDFFFSARNFPPTLKLPSLARD